MPTGPRPTPEGEFALLKFVATFSWESSSTEKMPNKGEDEPKPGITPAAEIPAPAWKPEVGILDGCLICESKFWTAGGRDL